MTYKRTDHYTCGHNIDFHSPEVHVENCFCGRGTYDGSLIMETRDNGADPRHTRQPYGVSILGEPINLNSSTQSFPAVITADEMSGMFSSNPFPTTYSFTINNTIDTPASPIPESQEPVPSISPDTNDTPTSTSVDNIEELNDHARTCPICIAERERTEAHRRRSTYEEEGELGENNEDERRIEDVDVI